MENETPSLQDLLDLISRIGNEISEFNKNADKVEYVLRRDFGIREDIMNKKLYYILEECLISSLNQYIEHGDEVNRKELKMVFDHFIFMNFTSSENDDKSYYKNPYNSDSYCKNKKRKRYFDEKID